MSGLCNSLYHLPLHGNAIWKGAEEDIRFHPGAEWEDLRSSRSAAHRPHRERNEGSWDQRVWRPGLGRLQSQQHHVVGQQRSVTGGAAPGLRIPPQGQRHTYQHPHAETWEHQVLGRVEKKRRGGDSQHSCSLCWGRQCITSRRRAGLKTHPGYKTG